MPTIAKYKDKQKYIDKARATEELYGIPPNTLVGLLAQESGYDNDVITGKRKSYAGAIGIAQFMSSTAKEYGIDPLNTDQAIDAAGKYLASSYKTFGNWDDAILSYNAGVGRVKQYKAGKPIKIQEHAEYVGRVKDKIAQYSGVPTKEQVTTDVNNLEFTQVMPTFAGVPDSAEQELSSKEKTDKDIEEVKQQTAEYNFLQEIQNAPQREQLAQTEEQQPQQRQQLQTPNYLEQYEQISQFVDSPIVGQQGGTWQQQQEKVKAEKLAKLRELLKDKDVVKNLEKEAQQRRGQLPTERAATQVDATKTSRTNNPNKTSTTARNKTDKEIAEERQARIDAQTQANAQPFDWSNFRQSLADRSIATGDALRISNEPNFFDDYLNPASMIGSMADNLGQAPLRAQQEDSYMPYVTAVGTPLVIGATAGIGTQNTGQFVNNLANPLAGTGQIIDNLGNKYLPNAYKLNPKAFKPNPEMGYRMLGREGFDDAINSGVLRAKPTPGGKPTEGISLARNTNRNPNTGKMQPALDRPYFADGFIDERYAADYMAAVNKTDNNLVPIPTHKGIAPSQAGNIPLENATLYKKDWLLGYKEIPKPPQIAPIRDLFIQPKQKFSNPNLSNIEEPYISKKVFNDNREQEIFESSFLPEQQNKLIENRTKYYDKDGNEIPKPSRFLQQGGQQKYSESELAFLKELPTSSRGMYDYPNQKVIVPTDGSITMKGISHKIKGVSLETGEEKIMNPNEEHFFNNTQNVLEIPIAQQGSEFLRFQSGGVKTPIYKNLEDFYNQNKDVTTYSNKDKKSINLFKNYNKYDQSLEYEYCEDEDCMTKANRVVDAFANRHSFFEDTFTKTKPNIGASLSTSTKPTPQQIAKTPYFKEDEKFGSLDSWDIAEQYKKTNPKSILFNAEGDDKNNINYEDFYKKYNNKVAVGSFIGLGNHTFKDGEKRANHTVRVVGFLDSGEPLVADYGNIKPLSQAMYIEGDKGVKTISHVLNIPNKDKYTYEHFKKIEDAKNTKTGKVYINNLKSVPVIEEGKVKYTKPSEEYVQYHNVIGNEKDYITKALGVDDTTYDKYAKIALTLGANETKYGTSKVFKYLNSFKDSKGVAQLREENVSEKYKETLSKYEKNSPEYNAVATMLYIKEMDKYKDNWMEKGKSSTERVFKRQDEETVKNTVRNFQGKKQMGYLDSDFGNDVFRDGDIEIELPYKQPWQSEEDYKKEVEEQIKKQKLDDVYSFRIKNGKREIVKKTKGTNIPNTLEDFVFYAWQSPNTVVSGDAQGDSNYYKKNKQYYNLLFSK
jgi:hypothetical protein